MILSIFPLGFQFLAPLAQLAEHRTLNPQVLGSSPRGRTTEVKPQFQAEILNKSNCWTSASSQSQDRRTYPIQVADP